jgi:endonuclease/exonuclease/phosphatase family metal-dependent hydrolase
MKSSHLCHSVVLVWSILFLFFFQLLADLIASIYAIGLLSVSLTPEVVCALLLLSPVMLMFLRKAPSGRALALLGSLVLLSRIIEVMLPTRGRMFVSGLGVAVFLVFLPAYLGSHPDETGARFMGIGLAFGVSLSILLRTLGSGVDLSSMGRFQVVGWGLASLAAVLLLRILPLPAETNPPALPSDKPGAGRARPAKVIGLSLGIATAIVLLYFAFTCPAVIARWTGDSYLLILALLLLALSGFVLGLAWKPTLIARIHPAILLAWNGLFVLCLALTVLAHQVRYPSTPAGYPFSPHPVSGQTIPLILTLLLSSVILVDFTVFSSEIVAEKPSIRLLGGSFALGCLFLLVMTFAQVFTTVYDYIPVVGPFFRDKFWLVFLAAGVALCLPTLLLPKKPFGQAEERGEGKFRMFLAVCMAFCAVVTLSGALRAAPRPSAPAESGNIPLRVLTYNIQQGYSRDGQINFQGQLTLLRQESPDVIGLQESDTARISGGNTDGVRYFADNLDMYSYYGPSTVAGTFGIALLSRYPIDNPRTFYLYSLGEQTAIIAAQIVFKGQTYNLYVTHLGNDGPILQQEQVLQLVQGQENVLLMGDFNFRPDSDQYRLTTTKLSDAWLLNWTQGEPSQEIDTADRIDYLFLSSGIQVIQSRFLTGPQSDHPALMTLLNR